MLMGGCERFIYCISNLSIGAFPRVGNLWEGFCQINDGLIRVLLLGRLDADGDADCRRDAYTDYQRC